MEISKPTVTQWPRLIPLGLKIKTNEYEKRDLFGGEGPNRDGSDTRELWSEISQNFCMYTCMKRAKSKQQIKFSV